MQNIKSLEWRKELVQFCTSIPEDVRERFMAKVQPGPACWEWSAAIFRSGYGQFKLSGKSTLAHRLAFLWSGRSYPPGTETGHRCGNKRCVRPAHLEAIDPTSNKIRSRSPWAKNRRKAHCPAGHELVAGNVVLSRLRSSGRRSCLMCHNARALAYKRLNPEKRRATQSNYDRANAARRADAQRARYQKRKENVK